MLHAQTPRRQRTIRREARVRGVGYLTGVVVAIHFRPAPADTGILFVRDDLAGTPSVPARVEHVVPRQRRTTLQRGEAVVEMVEHVLAALSGLRVDNCVVGVDAAETPGCDGSSQAFAESLIEAGIEEQDRPRRVVRIRAPIEVSERGARVTALPCDTDQFRVAYALDYGEDSPIPRQSVTVDVDPDTFRRDLAPSRTFLLAEEAQALRRAGIGAGTGVADLLIFGPEGPIGNALRFPDECARHKALDLIGDLALIGCDLAGQVVAHRSGHTLNAAMARKILESAEAEVQDSFGPGAERVEMMSSRWASLNAR